VDRVKIAQETISALQILTWASARRRIKQGRSASPQYPQSRSFIGLRASDRLRSSFCVRGTSPETQPPTGISLQDDCCGELVQRALKN